jgi:hypothetical protein
VHFHETVEFGEKIPFKRGRFMATLPEQQEMIPIAAHRGSVLSREPTDYRLASAARGPRD